MYTTQKSTEYGTGMGVNGTGKRAKIEGWYVISPSGRKARAFTGNEAEAKANKWAEFCNENF
jgi:hypothetical protein